MILAAGVYLGAQAKPDFSGKWVAVDPVPAAGDAAAGRGGGRGAGFQPGFGPEFTAKQDAKTLTITRGGQTTPLIHTRRVGEQEHRDARRSAARTDRQGNLGGEYAGHRDVGELPEQHSRTASRIDDGRP